MSRVRITAEAQGQYNDLPKVIRSRIEAIFSRLKQWPDISGAKPLRGQWVGRFRIRTGDYRVQFRVEGETVTVERIGHRDRFYEE